MRRALVAAIAVLFLISGCTSDDEPGTPDATSGSPMPSSSPSAAPTVVAPADLVVEPGAIGPATPGMSKADAVKTGLFDADVPPPVEGCDPFPLQWKKGYEGLDVVTGDDGSIFSLGVFEGGPRTSEDVGHGSTLAEVTEAYPNLSPVVDAGFGQAGAFELDGDTFIGFLFGGVTASSIEQSSTVTLMEVTVGEKPDLMRSGC